MIIIISIITTTRSGKLYGASYNTFRKHQQSIQRWRCFRCEWPSFCLNGDFPWLEARLCVPDGGAVGGSGAAAVVITATDDDGSTASCLWFYRSLNWKSKG